MKNVIIAVDGGFYFFGTLVDSAPEGYIKLVKFAMFGGFAGGKGLPGVCRGDKEATVTLDRFGEDQEGIFPVSAVFGIFDAIDLYQFSGTTLR